jgi:Fic family protein
MSAQFKHYDLKIVIPDFDSQLTTVILELEKLRDKRLISDVHPKIFFQLKDMFHLLESLGSARIEGNNTTITERIESEIAGDKDSSENMLEITNTEKAMNFTEWQINEDSQIDKAFISELHKIVVKDLTKEGSKTPGILRPQDVNIAGSNHKPPMHIKVNEYFDELTSFINQKVDKKYHLIITAIAHHRFAWIHPFDNGNGRVVRLLTYAMLIKQGFNVENGRILNPTAIFCEDRNKYYEMLAKADEGDDESVLIWCHYVLEGLLKEIKKSDKLLDRNYLVKKILIPAFEFCLGNHSINKREFDILKLSVTKENMEFVASDIEKIIPGKLPAERSRIIRNLREKKMLVPVEDKARKYVVSFYNSYLLRGVRDSLQKEGFISMPD